jgi:hypothetical protein
VVNQGALTFAKRLPRLHGQQTGPVSACPFIATLGSVREGVISIAILKPNSYRTLSSPTKGYDGLETLNLPEGESGTFRILYAIIRRSGLARPSESIQTVVQ